jgi:transposase-like protein
MKMPTTMYKRHQFPPEIIQYAVWLYHRFNLSHRDIEDLLVEREIVDFHRNWISFQCKSTARN